MMAAILNSAILDWDTLFSSLRFTQKHSHSTLTLAQTNLIWLKLIHSHSTWWWQPFWIWPSWIWPSRIQPSLFFLTNSLTLSWIGSHHLHKKTSLTLPSPPFAQKKLHSFILTQLNDGSHLEFYHVGLRKLHSFILTQLDDGSHLEFCHVGFRHLVFFSLRFTQKHSPSTLTLTQTNLIWLKLIHSHSTWWWQPSWILPSLIWPPWIQPS